MYKLYVLGKNHLSQWTSGLTLERFATPVQTQTRDMDESLGFGSGDPGLFCTLVAFCWSDRNTAGFTAEAHIT